MRKHIWGEVLVYVLWAIVLALGIWVLLLSRNAVLSVFSMLDTEATTAREGRRTTLDRFYIIGAGLAWLALMVLSEFYFRNGLRRGQLLQRFARILGIELLLLFIIDAVLLLVIGVSATTWLRWLILGGELVLGVACLTFARPAPALLSDVRNGGEG
ncbi:MAG: hypothetical protein JXC32_21145 [Anaerolineae bacterium]|nr:hypothetical protein [Anaerolineae bacterium]